MDCETCRFCEIIRKRKYQYEFDKPIMESLNYVALVSVGSFIEGWILIIPKLHCFSMREMYEDKEFTVFVDKLKVKLNEKYKKNVIMFEHGANHNGSQTACGTNHAHVHLLPMDYSIIENIKRDRKWKTVKCKEIKPLTFGHEYLLLNENLSNLKDSNYLVSILSEPVSQYFRRVLAKMVGMEDQFNYKKYPQMSLAKKTYLVMKEDDYG